MLLLPYSTKQKKKVMLCESAKFCPPCSCESFPWLYFSISTYHPQKLGIMFISGFCLSSHSKMKSPLGWILLAVLVTTMLPSFWYIHWCDGAPWPRQHMKELIGAYSSRGLEIMIIMVGNTETSRQAWCWSSKLRVYILNTNTRQREKIKRQTKERDRGRKRESEIKIKIKSLSETETKTWPGMNF